jgi:hypothetical protein
MLVSVLAILYDASEGDLRQLHRTAEGADSCKVEAALMDALGGPEFRPRLLDQSELRTDSSLRSSFTLQPAQLQISTTTKTSLPLIACLYYHLIDPLSYKRPRLTCDLTCTNEVIIAPLLRTIDIL